MGSGNEQGAGTNWGTRGAGQIPHLGNYTLTPTLDDSRAA